MVVCAQFCPSVTRTLSRCIQKVGKYVTYVTVIRWSRLYAGVMHHFESGDIRLPRNVGYDQFSAFHLPSVVESELSYLESRNGTYRLKRNVFMEETKKSSVV